MQDDTAYEWICGRGSTFRRIRVARVE